MNDRTDIIAENNRDALRRLMRIVTRSQGFSLSIALCNYRVLQKRVLRELRSQLAAHDLPETAIAILKLEPDAKTLLAPIQKLMGEVHKLPSEQKPKVLMVLGLDAATEIEAVLKSANRVREEFANCLEFPMVLWLSDRTQDILTREANDLANWTTAGAIEFQLEAVELKALVKDSLNAIFNRYLQPQGLGLGNANLRQMELMTAIAELESQQIELEQELRAGLDFAFGCMAMNEEDVDHAKDLLQRSLRFWWKSGAQPQQAACLLQLAMCDQNKAFRDRYHKQPFYESAQTYLVECLTILRNLQRWEMVALYINFLTAIMEESQDFEGLESLVNEALALRQTYPNQLREAHDHGILASVKLWQRDYGMAKELAESALALYHEGEALQLPNLIPAQRYAYGKLELWLAKALEGLSDRQGAIRQLEAVRDSWNHQYDAQIYVSVLEELRSLYTAAGLYLDAFETKQHQRSVEQQYGLRAFIGAGTLNPRREASSPNMEAAIAFRNDEIAQEIAASGRMPDVERLVDRIGQARFPLTVIHGDSGAGKSSILSGGVIPALRLRESFDGRKVLVLAVKTYKDWSAEIQRQLQDYFSDRPINLDPISHFHRNIEANYLTILIFDQFEDFFFKKQEFKDRLPFYKFLKACLHTDFVRVVLSLREDYLHYLLECDRAVDLEKVENDILGKQMRYYLGDFTQDQARRVIEELTRRSQLRLEPELIERLVTDLSNEQHRILPIELQVVGAQLESEIPPISTLLQYLDLTGDTHRKPSEVLVERWLENVVRDCGEANKDLAERVLYALTGNEEKRPQKTQAELAEELLGDLSGDGLGFRSPLPPLQRGALDTIGIGSTDNSVPLSKGDAEGRGIKPLNEAENLSLVLAVLVGSGLAFRVSSAPDDRFQLIHDYLVSFIRKKYVFGMAEELRMTKEQLRSALAEKDNALAEKDKELQRAEIAEIEAVSITCEAYWLAHKELDAMVAGLRAAKRIFDPNIRKIVPNYTEGRTFGRLWEVIYSIREANRLEGHRNEVGSVAFSPDGKTIVSASDDNTVKLWDLSGRELLTIAGHKSLIGNVIFSPDGKTIASGWLDNTIKLWDLNGKELLTIVGNKSLIGRVTFSPDGKTIASEDIDNTIKLWDLNGKELLTITGENSLIGSMAFSPNGTVIASGSKDSTIKLWDFDGKELCTLTGHSYRVSSLAFSPNGEMIASGSYDHTIKLWNSDGEELHTLRGHNKEVVSVVFSPDGNMIASSSDDNTIKLWNLDGEELHTLKGHNKEVVSVAFSPDGNMIASGSYDHTIRLWNLNIKKLRTFAKLSLAVERVTFSPNGEMLVSMSINNMIKLWSINGKELSSITSYSNGFGCVTVSPDGRTIASVNNDHTIKLWSIDGKELLAITRDSCGVHESVAFSLDGKMFASTSDNHTIKLWGVDGKELLTLTGDKNWVMGITFSPDSKTIASSISDNTIKLWNLDGKKLCTLIGHSNVARSIAFSPDGKTIASSSDDQTIKLWNLDGKELCTLIGHSNVARSIAFSPDGKTIASGSDDQTIKLWNLDGKELCTLIGHSAAVSSVTFSPDGKTIASGSYDNTIKLWDIDYDRAISEACDWLRPYLTNNPNVSESDRQLLESKK